MKTQRIAKIQLRLNLDFPADKILYQVLESHQGSLNNFIKKTLLLALTGTNYDNKNKRKMRASKEVDTVASAQVKQGSEPLPAQNDGAKTDSSD